MYHIFKIGIQLSNPWNSLSSQGVSRAGQTRKATDTVVSTNMRTTNLLSYLQSRAHDGISFDDSLLPNGPSAFASYAPYLQKRSRSVNFNGSLSWTGAVIGTSRFKYAALPEHHPWILDNRRSARLTATGNIQTCPPESSLIMEAANVYTHYLLE
jgi:hypothetical protein